MNVDLSNLDKGIFEEGEYVDLFEGAESLKMLNLYDSTFSDSIDNNIYPVKNVPSHGNVAFRVTPQFKKQDDASFYSS